MTDRSGAAAVVTGAGSGIGRAIARKLAGQGMHVFAADVAPARADATLELLRADGGASVKLPPLANPEG